VAGQLKVVCNGGIRIGIGGLALLAFLDVQIVIQIDINFDISVAVEANACVLHRIFIRHVGVFIAIRLPIFWLIMNKYTCNIALSPKLGDLNCHRRFIR
jgi:hypothetical protein